MAGCTLRPSGPARPSPEADLEAERPAILARTRPSASHAVGNGAIDEVIGVNPRRPGLLAVTVQAYRAPLARHLPATYIRHQSPLTPSKFSASAPLWES